MKKKYTLKYITSFFLLFVSISWSQELVQKDSMQIQKKEITIKNNAQAKKKELAKKDSIQPKKKHSIAKKNIYYAIRFGVDVSRPIIQFIQQENIGFEVISDFRIAKNWYLTGEFGYDSEPTIEEYLQFHTTGVYSKIGFNYNLYENLKGINNEVYTGFRYGYSTYQQELISYTNVDLNNYFGNHEVTANNIFKGLNAHWVELHFGIKVETLSHLFLSASIHFKKLLSSQETVDFNKLYIPGMGTTLLNKNAVGFNYTISYQIPLSKRK